MSCSRNTTFAAALALSLLAGCRPAPTPTAEPEAVYIGVTPAFADLAYIWLADFAVQDPLHELTIVELPLAEGLSAVKAGEIEFLITSAEPPAQWFAAPLAREALLVAVSQDVPVRTADLDTLKTLFTGRTADWETAGVKAAPVQPIVYPAGDELRQAFHAAVLGNSRITSNALLVPDPAAMSEQLGIQEGAIGLLPMHAATPELRILSIEGIRPTIQNIENQRYPLTIEVLALSSREPGGLARAWLGWIQAQTGVRQP